MLTDSTAAHMKWQRPCPKVAMMGSGCYPPIPGEENENANVLLLMSSAKWRLGIYYSRK